MIEDLHPEVSVYNNNLVGVESYNIFVGVSVATIFGAAFFFDLYWPERHESKPVRLAWKISTLIISVMMLSTALAMTVRLLYKANSFRYMVLILGFKIITATRSESINETDPKSEKMGLEGTKKSPALYRCMWTMCSLKVH